MRKPGTPGTLAPVLFALAIILIVVLGGCVSVCNRPGWDCKQVTPKALASSVVDSVEPWHSPTGKLVCIRTVYPHGFYVPTCWSVYHE